MGVGKPMMAFTGDGAENRRFAGFAQGVERRALDNFLACREHKLEIRGVDDIDLGIPTAPAIRVMDMRQAARHGEAMEVDPGLFAMGSVLVEKKADAASVPDRKSTRLNSSH